MEKLSAMYFTPVSSKNICRFLPIYNKPFGFLIRLATQQLLQ